ncbi:AAA family ATPase [Burkholderia pseudomallei]|uniref:AAA family ATPase n=1 Tax=Burkholderia pseudomallei TaxID=28450 RepID=UPI001AAFC42F|nr:AAA family ATPase [Burkholderia pseudomallei]MBO2985834.1 AAA family ATPase [Burkholderia pseudomallei]MBO7918298.1 AAA family ATPase [Burkholderia pseudomallei]
MTKATHFLVLLSGPLAVGKTTLRDYLVAKHGFDHVRSSTFLIEKARRENLLADRRGLQELGDRLDAETDYRWIVDEVALPSMYASTGQARWLVDAVRKPKQVEHFKSLEHVNVVHVHLTAPEEVLRLRYESRQAKNAAGLSAPSYDDAIAHPNEVAARSLIHIADIVADVTNENTAKLAELIISHQGE